MAMKPAVPVNQISWSAVRETTVTQITIWQLAMKGPRNIITRVYHCVFLNET